jgi:RNA polymerase sigma factor (sigma-70 family)
MRLSEATLVEQARDGSEDAFAALVEEHAAPLYRFLCRKTGNAADAEDLVQQTFVKAHRALARFNTRKPLAPWLFTIARNLAASHYRSQRLIPGPEREHDERTPLANLEEAEAGRLLWDWARRTLPEAQFTVLWLRVEDGLDVAATAARMRKSPANVKVLLHRARKRLAAAYEDQGDPVSLFGMVAEAPL